ncbi:hypothetical protein BD560DRAFT_400782 [Blakeslea trispora]|nr:hypothetical protein BD560DRAFT_400782 [Blakeslea trispora]
MTEQTFSNNFWGLKDDGFHVLTAKMNSTKKTFDEIKSFYNIRASLHEEFGRKLMKHAKTGMGSEETGTLHVLLSAAHREMEWTAQAHLNLAQKLKNRLEIDLENFTLEQKDRRKLTHANVEKVHRYKQSSEAYLAKTKEKYEADCAKLRLLESQLETAVSTRDIEKIKQRIERTEHEIRIQEQEYKNACIKVADATENWNKAWKMSCDTYQVMEKKRLEFLHHSFSMYISVLSTATSQDQESYERFWRSLDQYDPIEDIKAFISERATGSQIPEPEMFVPYSEDPQKTLQRYTLANFSAPPELVLSSESSTERKVTEEPLVPKESSNNTYSEQSESTTQGVSKEQISEVSKFKKDPVERKKSIIRNIIKPLPSISTPRMRIRRKSTQKQDAQPKKTVSHLPPVLVVPDLAEGFSSSVSESEDSTARVSTEEDVPIDPRAKVVFAVGNNIFDLGNLDLEDDSIISSNRSNYTRYPKDNTKLSNSSNNRVVNRQRRRSVDFEAASNISYQSLLEELGLFGENNDKHSKPVSKRSVTKTERMNIGDTENSTSQEQRWKESANKQPKSKSQPTNQFESQSSRDALYQPITLADNPSYIYQENKDSFIHPTPQHTYNNTAKQTNNNDYHTSYSTQATLNSCQPYQSAYSYYHPYSDIAHSNVTMSSTEYPYCSASNDNTYCPPSNVPQGIQPTLFWALALDDWYTGNPEELQYSRGTWLAVTEVQDNGWYFAAKFDSRANCLTNEKGYVAQNYVQVYS